LINKNSKTSVSWETSPVPSEEPPILPELSGVLSTRMTTINTEKVLSEESPKELVLPVNLKNKLASAKRLVLTTSWVTWVS